MDLLAGVGGGGTLICRFGAKDSPCVLSRVNQSPEEKKMRPCLEKGEQPCPEAGYGECMEK